MISVFWGATSATPDVSSWDTSSVTNMSEMFDGSAADQDTLDWYAQQCARPEVDCGF